VAARRHLTNAPITEALIDIRVKLPDNVDLNTLASVHAAFASDYPNKRERVRGETKIDLKTKKTETTSAVDGYLFTSSDGEQVVQNRLDGFTFSRLKPYESWGKLREEAYRLWQIYRGSCHPESITRIALRYINRLEIMLPIRDFEDYLTAPPIVPKNLSQELSGFLTRNIIREEAHKVVVIISQALESVSSSKIATIILDIDVFREHPSGLNETDAWTGIDDLHELKNKVFFESVTEKTLEPYI
jgi:uncharacterized protein (TIGR04255 family)